MKTQPLSLVDDIIAYEAGELEENEVIELFQALLDSGLFLHLQGHYGRTIEHLILTDQIKVPQVKL